MADTDCVQTIGVPGSHFLRVEIEEANSLFNHKQLSGLGLQKRASLLVFTSYAANSLTETSAPEMERSQ